MAFKMTPQRHAQEMRRAIRFAKQGNLEWVRVPVQSLESVLDSFEGMPAEGVEACSTKS